MSPLGRVSGIAIYPIKGVRAVDHQSSIVETRGLQGDRRYVIVDENDLFLSQRATPELATLSALPTKQGLEISSKDGDRFRVKENSNERRFIQIWKSYVDGVDLGDEAAAWLTQKLQTKCRLVRMDELSERPTNPDFSDAGDEVSFADGFPLLLTSDASLADLNARMDAPVPMNRFRPNVVVAGFEAWAEDGWSLIRIGKCIFKVVKPCRRCLVTTTDQSTGERMGPEPLRTLATFRQQGPGVAFGENLVPSKLGTIHLGDNVEVLARRT